MRVILFRHNGNAGGMVMSEEKNEVQTVEKNDENINQQLLAILGKEKKKGKGKILLAAGVIFVLAAGSAAAY